MSPVRRWGLLSLLLIGLSLSFAALSSVPAVGQPPQPKVELRYLDARGYPTVNAYLVVNDNGVDADAFTVEEDGAPLAAMIDELANEPVAMMIVLDASGSMSVGGKATSALEAVQQLMTISRPFDPVGLVTFADVPTIAAPIDTNRAPLESTLGSYSTGGGTAFLDAVSTAVDALSSTRPGRRIVLALSDGLDNRSVATNEQVIAKAIANGVAVWTVGYGDRGGSEDSGIDVASLTELARQTGGEAVISPDAGTVQTAFSRIAADVQREVHISFVSARAADGTTRRLTFALGEDAVSVDYNPGGVVPVAIPSVNSGLASPSSEGMARRVSDASRWWLSGLILVVLASILVTRGGYIVRRARFGQRWIRTLHRRDSAIGRVCANEGDERYAVEAGDTVVTCPNCEALHHLDCWHLNDERCYTPHCAGASPVRGRSHVARYPSKTGSRYSLRDVAIIGLALGGAFVASERSGPVVAAVLTAAPSSLREEYAVEISEGLFAFLLVFCVAVLVRSFSDIAHTQWRRAIVRAFVAALSAGVLAAASLIAADQLFRGLGGGQFARIVAWTLFGACVGLACLGGRFRYALRGAAGGMAGGLVGGIVLVGLQWIWEPALAAIPGVALVAAGSAIGAFGLARALERAWLEGVGGSVVGRVFPLDKYVGGRTGWAVFGSASRKVQLWAKDLASTHARIGLEGSHFVIEDLGGGVIVDGTAVNRSVLRDNSAIDLGSVRFRYRERRR